MLSEEELINRFTYHAPNSKAMVLYPKLRAATLDLARLFVKEAPASRELALALTKLEEAMMHVNSAVARNQDTL